MADAEDDWDFEEMVSIDEISKYGACEKMKGIQRICEDGSNAVVTSVVEVIDLSREVVETNSDNAKFDGSLQSLVIRLNESRAGE